MKYRAMAKHFILEAARLNREVQPPDGNRFGDNKDFTPKQTKKLQEEVDKELDRMETKLRNKKIIE